MSKKATCPTCAGRSLDRKSERIENRNSSKAVISTLYTCKDCGNVFYIDITYALTEEKRETIQLPF